MGRRAEKKTVNRAKCAAKNRYTFHLPLLLFHNAHVPETPLSCHCSLPRGHWLSLGSRARSLNPFRARRRPFRPLWSRQRDDGGAPSHVDPFPPSTLTTYTRGKNWQGKDESSVGDPQAGRTLFFVHLPFPHLPHAFLRHRATRGQYKVDCNAATATTRGHRAEMPPRAAHRCRRCAAQPRHAAGESPLSRAAESGPRSAA